MHREGLIELPAVCQVVRNPLVHRSQPVLVSIDETPLQARSAKLGPLEMHQVRRTPEETSLSRQQNESEVVERLYQFVTPAQTGVQLIKQTVQRIDIKAI